MKTAQQTGQENPVKVTVEYIQCRNCQEWIRPTIKTGKIIYPERCPKKTCRSTTYNYTAEKLQKIKRTVPRRIFKISCKYCDKSYENTDKLQQHLKNHTTYCLTCELKFTALEGLAKHNLRRHSSQSSRDVGKQ